MRAQADPEDRFVEPDGFRNDRSFSAQVRMPRCLVNVHRSAEYDEAIVLAYVGLGARFATEVDVANSNPCATQQRIEVTEWLRRDVLENEDPAHGDC